MKKILALMITLMVICTPAFANLVVNGDFSDGEDGWTRWNAPGWPGLNYYYSITHDGPTAPEGTLSIGIPGMNEGQASFGWFQRISSTPGSVYEIAADWAGDMPYRSWAEIMLFSVESTMSNAEIIGMIDAGAADNIAFKKDAWNRGVTWGWEAASLSPHEGGNAGVVTATGDEIVVAMKFGHAMYNDTLWASFDNITVVPEPGSMLALGTGLAGLAGFVVRRRRS